MSLGFPTPDRSRLKLVVMSDSSSPAMEARQPLGMWSRALPRNNLIAGTMLAARAGSRGRHKPHQSNL